MSIIKLSGINKVYRTNEIETLALENVNLTVDKGEFVSIMGPSGCGKSTLLNVIGLLDEPTSGTIEMASMGQNVFKRETRPANRAPLGPSFSLCEAVHRDCDPPGRPPPQKLVRMHKHDLLTP